MCAGGGIRGNEHTCIANRVLIYSDEQKVHDEQKVSDEEESAHQLADGREGRLGNRLSRPASVQGREGRLGYRLFGPASVQGNVHRIDSYIRAAPHFLR